MLICDSLAILHNVLLFYVDRIIGDIIVDEISFFRNRIKISCDIVLGREIPIFGVEQDCVLIPEFDQIFREPVTDSWDRD